MSIERTLTIIKPDGVARNLAGTILGRIEQAGFRIVGLKRLRLSQAQAKAFYAVHAARPFYNDLVKFMTEGPVVVAALERENAVTELRKLMGATNPANADAGTIRKDFAESIERNVIHGSDAAETAAVELSFYFAASELL